MAQGSGSTLDYAQIERILVDELIAHEELPVITPKYVCCTAQNNISVVHNIRHVKLTQ
jgi:hypothetical protein